MAELPAGTVTFLFTDIEGSTKLAHELGTDRWHEVLMHHARLVRDAVTAHGGVEVRTEGDGFLVAFRRAYDAVAAAADAQRGLAAHEWPNGVQLRVRMGMHTGERAVPASPTAGADYVGYDVHRAARITAAAHGGQVLLSSVAMGLLGDDLPVGVRVRDLGEHRLKDISQSEPLYQLVIEGLPDAFPPLRALGRAPHNLPVQMTSFVGREREVAEGMRLLAGTRLLTLIGPGGAGKTRLALEVAAHLVEEFEDGVVFVPLAPLRDARLVLLTIARTFGVHEASGRPIFDSLVTALREARRLLVLDNFEQVIEAAGHISDLLAARPLLKIIVTSRSALRLAGEREFPVDPMAVPDPSNLPPHERLTEYESVRLFVERARAVRPDFAISAANAAAVAAICARLDGLPLAVELAAARTRVLSPQEIAARLDHRLGLLTGGPRDQPARQQTLRDTIAWSYELLDPPEQLLLRRLATFPGGCTIAAAEEVCDGSPLSIVDGLDSLVRKSLLRRIDTAGGQTRFALLQTVREYAEEQLHASGEAERIHDAQADHYRRLAEAEERRLEGPEQAAAIRALEEERENLRAALDWSIERRDFERGASVAGALAWFWWLRGYLTEGRSWLERILALPDATARTAWRAKALYAAGMIALQQKDYASGRAWLEEAVAIRRELDDTVGLADALHFLGDVVLAERGPMEAAKLYEEGVELARAAGRTLTWGVIRAHQALNAIMLRDHPRARAILEDSLPVARRLGGPWHTAGSLLGFGLLARAEGEPDRAQPYLHEAVSLLRDIGDRFMLLIAMLALAATYADRGDAERALRLAGAVEAEADRIGSSPPPPIHAMTKSAIDAAKASLPGEMAQNAYAAGRAMTIESAIEHALETGVPPRLGAASVSERL